MCLIFMYSASAQELDQAIRDGDMLLVKELLAADPGLLDKKNDDALTPLNLACEQGQAGIVDLLLEAGADPYIGDNENSMPLHLAAISGSLEALDRLLDEGVGIDIQDDNGMTALLFAISRRTWAAGHLIARGADINLQSNVGWAPVHLAIATRNEALARELIEAGAKLNVSVETGVTPLISAASYGYADLLKLLMEKGADMNAESNDGRQALSYTANDNAYECAEYLIKNGMDVMHKDDHGWTALHHIAIRGNSTRMAGLLIESGADVNATDSRGHNALYAAVRSHHPDEMCRFLILNGAEVNPPRCSIETPCSCYPDYDTPLHAAARHRRAQLVKDLLQSGAKLNVYNADGLTPLHSAVQGGSPEIVEFLVDKGAFLDTRDLQQGYSGLHYAALRGFGDIMSYLLDKGSDPAMQGNDGKTAFDLAMYYGHRTMAYELLAAGAPDDHLHDALNAPDEFLQPLEQGQAQVWFLGHSGWAVKTKEHFLVFDYFCNNWEKAPDDSCLSSGHIIPEMLAGQNVTVFSTHAHGDHYDPRIFSWKESNPDINYVLCWNQDTEGHDYTLVPVHGEEEVNGMQVYVHYSTDLGGGYLVEVDGLTILHMGDHANGEDGLMPEFTAEIDLIRERGAEIDILFGGIRGCSLGEPEQVKKGIYYTLETLNPALFVPMHCGGHSDAYREFTETAKDDGLKAKMKYVTNKGDRFRYSKSKKDAVTVL